MVLSTAGWVRTPDGACGVLEAESPTRQSLLPACRFSRNTRGKSLALPRLALKCVSPGLVVLGKRPPISLGGQKYEIEIHEPDCHRRALARCERGAGPGY